MDRTLKSKIDLIKNCNDEDDHKDEPFNFNEALRKRVWRSFILDIARSPIVQNKKPNEFNTLTGVRDLFEPKKRTKFLEKIISMPQFQASDVFSRISKLRSSFLERSNAFPRVASDTPGSYIREEDIIDPNEVVEELLTIVYNESQSLDNFEGNIGNPEENIVVLRRLEAILENWKNDKAFTLSSNDSWTLKRRRPSSEDETELETTEEETVCSSRTSENEVPLEIYYPERAINQDIPIRKRLRESWKNDQRTASANGGGGLYHASGGGSSQYAASDTSLYPDLYTWTLFNGKNVTFCDPNHLLPHPNDLMLLERGE